MAGADLAALEARRQRLPAWRTRPCRLSFDRMLGGETRRRRRSSLARHRRASWSFARARVAVLRPERGVLISGDMLLPKISTNVSVDRRRARRRSASRGSSIRSSAFDRRCRPRPLVLPSHGLPLPRHRRCARRSSARITRRDSASSRPRCERPPAPALRRRSRSRCSSAASSTSSSATSPWARRSRTSTISGARRSLERRGRRGRHRYDSLRCRRIIRRTRSPVLYESRYHVRHRQDPRRARSRPAPSHDPAALAESLRTRRREEREGDRRLRRAPGEVRQVARRRRARDRQGVHGARREDARESVPARRIADEPVVELHEPLAGVDDQAAGRRSRSRRDAGQGRQAVPARGLGAAFPVRLHQAELPHRRATALHDAVGNVEGSRRRDEAQGQFLHAPVHRRARAVEFRADQSGSVPRDDRDRRAEPRQGPQQPPRRHRARQRPAQDLDDRPEGLRARRQHRDHARQGRVPERSAAAHPVRADDAEGREAAAARHPAVDQQVLHPRSAREELVREVGGRPGPHRLRHLLGQSRRASSRTRTSRTT